MFSETSRAILLWFWECNSRFFIIIIIGRALKGNIDTEKKRIFSKSDPRIGSANQAASFYSLQIKSARLAVDMWVHIAIRFGIVKDIRRLISKVIWDARIEANYKLIDARMQFNANTPALGTQALGLVKVVVRVGGV